MLHVLTRSLHRVALAALVLLLVPALASAAQARWTFSNAKFSDGGTISGYFIYDSANDTLGDYGIAVTKGSSADFPSIIYTDMNGASETTQAGDPQLRFLFALAGSNRQLRFTPAAGLSNEGGTVALNVATAANNAGSIECFNCGPARTIVSGSLVGTPATARFAVRPALTGNWDDPMQDGHGFQFEVLPGGVVTAFWFTFDNAGNPAWIVAAGTLDHDSVVMLASRSLNGKFPPNFNSASVTHPAWGSLVLKFEDCDRGSVQWLSTDPAFTASGTMTLQRLTQIDGLPCG